MKPWTLVLQKFSQILSNLKNILLKILRPELINEFLERLPLTILISLSIILGLLLRLTMFHNKSLDFHYFLNNWYFPYLLP